MRGWFLVGFVVIACHTNRLPVANGSDGLTARLAEINARYDRLAADTQQRWDQISHLADQLRSDEVQIEQSGLPVELVRTKFQGLYADCTHRAVCEQDVGVAYSTALQARYYLADFASAYRVFDERGGTLDFEVFLAQSHNVALSSKIREFDRRVSSGLVEALGGVEAAREAEIRAVAEDRVAAIRTEIQQEKAERARIIAALAAGLMAFGQSLQASRPYELAPSSCCKVCVVGKPCGNACINALEICHVGPGCACIGPGR